VAGFELPNDTLMNIEPKSSVSVRSRSEVDFSGKTVLSVQRSNAQTSAKGCTGGYAAARRCTVDDLNWRS
jgi:hypothetical protein